MTRCRTAPALELVPRRADDPRFAWRVAEVPAASHPTVAAALAFVAGARDGRPRVGSVLRLGRRARRARAPRAVARCSAPTSTRTRSPPRARTSPPPASTATLARADARTHAPRPVDLDHHEPAARQPRAGRRRRAARRRAARTSRARSRRGGRLVWITPASKQDDAGRRAARPRAHARRSRSISAACADQLERWERRGRRRASVARERSAAAITLPAHAKCAAAADARGEQLALLPASAVNLAGGTADACTPSASNTRSRRASRSAALARRRRASFARPSRPQRDRDDRAANASSMPGDASPEAMRDAAPCDVAAAVRADPRRAVALGAVALARRCRDRDPRPAHPARRSAGARGDRVDAGSSWLVAPSLRSLKPTVVAIVAIVLGARRRRRARPRAARAARVTAVERCPEASAAAVRARAGDRSPSRVARDRRGRSRDPAGRAARARPRAGEEAAARRRSPPVRTYLRVVVAALVVWSPIAARCSSSDPESR